MNIQGLVLLFSCILSVTCFAAEDVTMAVDSDHADYNGKKMTLSGNVAVEHEFGSISADWVEAIPDTINKKIRFTMLTLKGNVAITMKDGGKLTCARANIDFNALQGHFYGDTIQEYVVYSENSGPQSLTVESREMFMTLSEGNLPATQLPHNRISDITANDKVTIHYQDFIANADSAVYRRLSEVPIEKNGARMPGLITLRAKDAANPCQVANRNGDLIKATQICIDTVKKNLLFAYPKGALSVAQEKNQRERIDFSGDTMTWDDPNRTLTLRDHTLIQDDMGEISADTLTVHYKVEEQKIVPSQLILEGNVHILNRGAVDPERKGPYLQYALADRVEYLPQAKEISLSSRNEGRVLFFDTLNHLQVSAPALTIKRDQTTKKESIQGSGDVRFNFVEKEIAEMKKYFPLSEALEEPNDHTVP